MKNNFSEWGNDKMFYFYKRKLYMPVILSVMLILCCIKPVNSGTVIMPKDRHSLSGLSNDISANEIIKTLKTTMRQAEIQRKQEYNNAYIIICIVEIFIVPLLTYGAVIHFRYRQKIKLWHVISYIHCLDGKKGGFIFYMI